jgi:hypothetical protein
MLNAENIGKRTGLSFLTCLTDSAVLKSSDFFFASASVFPSPAGNHGISHNSAVPTRTAISEFRLDIHKPRIQKYVVFWIKAFYGGNVQA